LEVAKLSEEELEKLQEEELPKLKLGDTEIVIEPEWIKLFNEGRKIWNEAHKSPEELQQNTEGSLLETPESEEA